MKQIWIKWSWGLPLLACSVGWAQEAEQTVQLMQGAQQEIVAAGALERVAIGDPGVLDVLVLRTHAAKKASSPLLLLGKAAGETSLMVWLKGQAQPKRYKVQVQAAAASSLLGGLPQARISALGKSVLLDGQVADAQSHARLAAAGQDSLGKPVVQDNSLVMVKSGTVQVDVKVVEFSKTVLKEAGLNIFSNRNGFGFGVFAPSSLKGISGGGSLAPLAMSSSNPISQAFNLVLSSSSGGIVGNLGMLEGNGLARVLAEPSLVALSGQSASFLSGGEVPVPVPQSLGTVTIEYKPYGIGLKVTPTVLADDRIALKVAPEASDLDYTNSVNLNGVAVPAIVTRRADTTVELGDGESFVIGGLVSRHTTSNLDKVPLLGDIPILGVMFKRQNYQQSEKELVIVVTPRLVKPLPRGTELERVLPGQAERRDAPGWQPYWMGRAAKESVPGFSD